MSEVTTSDDKLIFQILLGQSISFAYFSQEIVANRNSSRRGKCNRNASETRSRCSVKANGHRVADVPGIISGIETKPCPTCRWERSIASH